MTLEPFDPMFSPCLSICVHSIIMHSCIHPYIHSLQKKNLKEIKSFFFANIIGTMESERRNTKCFKFPSQDLHNLRLLASLISEEDYFREQYGSLLFLLHPRVPEGLLKTLVQFYDPRYHCFTFPDYQLVPTLEEFSRYVGIPVSDDIPFSGPEEPIVKHKIAEALRRILSDIPITTKGGIEGIAAEFLEDRAFHCKNIGSIDGFHAALALLIYGLVLFPNIENCVDMNAIKIFLNGNPVPTLLGDALHSIHSRTLKGGGKIKCCVPLLYKWYNAHLPTHNFFRDNPDKQEWSQRIMSLRAEDITWFYPGSDMEGIIDGCGEFPNVPLIGRYGGINYHPALERRQAALPMKEKPSNIYLDNIFFHHEENELWRIRINHAWNRIHRKERNILGRRDCTAYTPYSLWVCERACELKMPYPPEIPMS